MNNENNKQDNKIFIRIDIETIKQLMAVASPQEITPDLITRIINHAHSCEKWRLE